GEDVYNFFTLYRLLSIVLIIGSKVFWLNNFAGNVALFPNTLSIRRDCAAMIFLQQDRDSIALMD
ncbi:MAG: hypothetical protein MUO68_24835, partial [Desulfobacteraceae bacterium]|nr:hypothetical protein [Desulfobacteraceae bacterium]